MNDVETGKVGQLVSLVVFAPLTISEQGALMKVRPQQPTQTPATPRELEDIVQEQALKAWWIAHERKVAARRARWRHLLHRA